MNRVDTICDREKLLNFISRALECSKLEVAILNLAIAPNVAALTVPNSILPLALVNATIGVDLATISASEPILELALVNVLVMPHGSSDAVLEALFVHLAEVVFFEAPVGLVDHLQCILKFQLFLC